MKILVDKKKRRAAARHVFSRSPGSKTVIDDGLEKGINSVPVDDMGSHDDPQRYSVEGNPGVASIPSQIGDHTGTNTTKDQGTDKGPAQYDRADRNSAGDMRNAGYGEKPGKSAFVCVKLPKSLAKQYPSLDEDSSPPHITVLYLGKVDMKRKDELVHILRALLVEQKILDCWAHGLGWFKNPKGQQIAHTPITCDGLGELHRKIRNALEAANFKIEHNFKDYKPHITLGYFDKKEYEEKQPDGQFKIKELTLWGMGNEIKIPFGKTKKSVNSLVKMLFKRAQNRMPADIGDKDKVEQGWGTESRDINKLNDKGEPLNIDKPNPDKRNSDEEYGKFIKESQLEEFENPENFPINDSFSIDDADNLGSISASYNEGEYTILPGIRDVPLSEWNINNPNDVFVASDDIKRSYELAESIKKSGVISPLIMVLDENDLYVLEGNHRLAAAAVLHLDFVPALIIKVIYEDENNSPLQPEARLNKIDYYAHRIISAFFKEEEFDIGDEVEDHDGRKGEIVDVGGEDMLDYEHYLVQWEGHKNGPQWEEKYDLQLVDNVPERMQPANNEDKFDPRFTRTEDENDEALLNDALNWHINKQLMHKNDNPTTAQLLFRIAELREKKKQQIIQILSQQFAPKDIEEKVLPYIDDADPTQNDKYVKWIAKQILDGLINIDRFAEDYNEIASDLEQFITLKQQNALQDNNINNYNYSTLGQTIRENYEGSAHHADPNFDPLTLEGVNLVAQKGQYKIYSVTDVESLKDIGDVHPESKWCTRRSYSPCYAEQAINDYGVVYEIFKNNEPYIQTDPKFEQFLDIHDEWPQIDDEPELKEFLSEFFVPKIIDSGDADAAYEYVKNISYKERIPELEKLILNSGDVESVYHYTNYMMPKGQRVPELEKTLIDSYNTHYAYEYAYNVALQRIPEIEKMFLDSENIWILYIYAKNVAKERIPEFEKKIIDSGDTDILYQYVKNPVGMSDEQAQDYIDNYSKIMSIDEYLNMLNEQQNTEQQIDENNTPLQPKARLNKIDYYANRVVQALSGGDGYADFNEKDTDSAGTDTGGDKTSFHSPDLHTINGPKEESPVPSEMRDLSTMKSNEIRKDRDEKYKEINRLAAKVIAMLCPKVAQSIEGNYSKLDKQFAHAEDKMGELSVTRQIHNYGTIRSSLSNYEILSGIREVPIAEVKSSKLPNNIQSARHLAETIKDSKEVDPSIITVNGEGDMRVLEGENRINALELLGMKAFPAVVVIDYGDKKIAQVNTDHNKKNNPQSPSAPPVPLEPMAPPVAQSPPPNTNVGYGDTLGPTVTPPQAPAQQLQQGEAEEAINNLTQTLAPNPNTIPQQQQTLPQQNNWGTGTVPQAPDPYNPMTTAQLLFRLAASEDYEEIENLIAVQDTRFTQANSTQPQNPSDGDPTQIENDSTYNQKRWNNPDRQYDGHDRAVNRKEEFSDEWDDKPTHPGTPAWQEVHKPRKVQLI